MIFSQLTTNVHHIPTVVRLSDIINDVPVVQLSGPWDADIAGITTDSRKIQPRWLFAATEGEHVDGHLFVQQAIEQGASCVIVQRKQYEAQLKHLLTPSYIQHNLTTIVIVEDSRIAIAVLADRFHNSPSSAMKMIGITGTNGKTTTSMLVKSILESVGEKVGLIGTIEYHIGDVILPASFTTPPAEELHRLFAMMRDAGCTSVVMEVSSHALALKRVYGVLFDVTLFTNLTQDHLDFHGTMQSYRDAKSVLFQSNTKRGGIINTDDSAAKEMVKGLGKKKVTFGRNGRPMYKIQSVKLGSLGMTVKIVRNETVTTLSSPLLGMFNAYNLTAAYAIGKMCGIADRTIQRAVKNMKQIPGRFERIQAVDGVIGIVDYSHTPDSLSKAISTCRELLKKNGKLITVFGCGGDRDQSKRQVMGQVASTLSDVTIVTSDNPRTEDPERIIDAIMDGVDTAAIVHRQSDRRKAIHFALKAAQPSDIVLVAGKGHETYQIIGTKKTHFDDREIMRKYFHRYRGGVAA